MNTKKKWKSYFWRMQKHELEKLLTATQIVRDDLQKAEKHARDMGSIIAKYLPYDDMRVEMDAVQAVLEDIEFAISITNTASLMTQQGIEDWSGFSSPMKTKEENNDRRHN